MTDLSKPEVIITHESDLDGLLAGVLLQRLAKKLFGATSRSKPIITTSGNSATCANGPAGWRTSPLSRALDKAEWVVIDHHVTEAAPKYASFIHDVNKSAGLLCYELCKESGIQSPALDRLVHLNNVADLFLEDDPDFVVATDYANLVKIYQFWNLHTLIGGEIEKLLDHPLLEVMAVKRRDRKPARLRVEQKQCHRNQPDGRLCGHRGRQQQSGRSPVAGGAGDVNIRCW